MESITRMVLDYSDDTFEKSLEETGWKSYIKAFWSGCVEGFVDSMFIFGTIMWIITVFFKKKS